MLIFIKINILKNNGIMNLELSNERIKRKLHRFPLLYSYCFLRETLNIILKYFWFKFLTYSNLKIKFIISSWIIYLGVANQWRSLEPWNTNISRNYYYRVSGI